MIMGWLTEEKPNSCFECEAYKICEKLRKMKKSKVPYIPGFTSDKCPLILQKDIATQQSLITNLPTGKVGVDIMVSILKGWLAEGEEEI